MTRDRGRKRPRAAARSPLTVRQPYTPTPAPGEAKPTWAVSRLDCIGPFQRGIDLADFKEILDFLPQIEKLTWKEILRKHSPHHHVETYLICTEAQRRLKALED